MASHSGKSMDIVLQSIKLLVRAERSFKISTHISKMFFSGLKDICHMKGRIQFCICCRKIIETASDPDMFLGIVVEG
jgi:hypothetical protein